MKRIRVIDSHTGGEPTRLVLDGFPDLGHGSMSERRQLLAERFDDWRAASMLEPRGSDVLVGALLCQPVDPSASAGVIFFNNSGYLGMCGHGTIGLIISLAHLGRIQTGLHRIETPVGTVEATLHEDRSVSVRNVPAYRYRQAVSLQVPGLGTVSGDIAWGGNWFFLIAEHGQRIAGDNLEALTAYCWAVRQALETQGIRGEDGGEIDHIELFVDPETPIGSQPSVAGEEEARQEQAKKRSLQGVNEHFEPALNAASCAKPAAASLRADSRNFVLCPGKAYDRSPCGTGTSAKLACLAADGKLHPGQLWRQASVIGSQFEASYEWQDDGRIVPTIRGRAHLSAEATLLLEDDDPFAWGIRP
jgi:4-hydroxyproline epimerase